MSKELLLVGSPADPAWSDRLRAALQPLGELYLVSEEKALGDLRSRDYDLILVDATYLDDVTKLVATLHTEKPGVPIVVVSILATWERVRAVLMAGAADYIQKSQDLDMLFKSLSEILSRPKQDESLY